MCINLINAISLNRDVIKVFERTLKDQILCRETEENSCATVVQCTGVAPKDYGCHKVITKQWKTYLPTKSNCQTCTMNHVIT